MSQHEVIEIEPSQVSALATCLSSMEAVRWWLMDLVNPMLLGMVGARWPTTEAASSAPFQFAPRDSVEFFEPLGENRL